VATAFPENLALLRRERGESQRAAAGALGISQALLSHYEKGIREPRLEFVSRVCAYYGVSADFILGVTEERNPAEASPAPATETDPALLPGMVAELMTLAEDAGAAEAAAACVALECYRVYCRLTGSDPDHALLAEARLLLAEARVPRAQVLPDSAETAPFLARMRDLDTEILK